MSLREHSGPEELERPIAVGRAEALLLASLFARLPIVAGLNLAVALGTAAVFVGRRSPLELGAWLLVMILTLGLRLQSWRAFRRAPADATTAPAWARRFTLGAAATGATWGLAAVLFYAPWPAQIFLPFVMAGMVGGSITALTGHMPAYIAFSVCTLVPYAARLAVEGDPPHLVMAALVILYLIGMGVLGRAVSASLVASMRLMVENEDLVIALREKSAQLEATFENVHQGVAVFEHDARLATWNARHRELHGYPSELYRRGAHLNDFLRYDLSRGGDRGPTDEARLRMAARRPAPARFEQPGPATGSSRSSAARCRAAASSAPRPTSPTANGPKPACCTWPSMIRSPACPTGCCSTIAWARRWRAAGATKACWRSSWSTWTGSRRSTTRSGIGSATAS